MANQHRGSHDGGDMTSYILGAMVLLVFIWVAKPRAEHIYYTSMYYQYRGMEYVLPDKVLNTFNLKEHRRALAKSLNKGRGNYNVEALSKHALSPRIFYGFLVAIVFIVMGLKVWRGRPDNYTSKLSMEEMELRILDRYWQNAPVIGRHLDRRHPLKDKHWRFSRKPWEFAYEFGILTDGDGNKIPIEYEQLEIYMVKPTAKELENRIFNRKVAEYVFKKQLGRRIEIKGLADVLKLPAEYRALIVPLLAEIDGFYQDKVGISDVWLKQYALSFLDPVMVTKSIFNREMVDQLPPFKRETLNMHGVDEALATAFEIPSASEHLMTAAYENSLLVQLMEKTVVMKSSYFKWLKPMNRSLWYGMNNVGRPGSLHSEGAGLSKHAEFELKAKRAEYVPQVGYAVDGLKEILTEYYFLNK